MQVAFLALMALALSVPRETNGTKGVKSPLANVTSYAPRSLFVPYKHTRYKRAPHTLLGPFDFNKLFKKKKKPRMEAELAPSAFPLRGVASPHTAASMTSTILLSDTVHKPEPNITIIPSLASITTALTTLPATSKTNGTTESAITETETIAITTTPKTKGTSKTDSKQKKVKTRKNKNNSTMVATSRSASARRSAVAVKKKDEAPWPVKHAAVVDGDIILGGLMMVHGRSEGATCGPVMAQGGVQALEAMLYALDYAAANAIGPPGVKIGALVLDDCDNDTYGLEMALDFIKGSISNIEEEYACATRGVQRQIISGVVGAASSVTSVQVANLLRLFKIPQVSYFSTSPELSNKARFEYFTRTIPSDLHQVRAMVEIVKKFGWRYVSIIYEESNYGIKAFEELETLLARNDICIAVKERLVKDSGEATASAYDVIVARLLSRPRARGVIVFGSDQEVAGVMQAVVRAGAEGTFGWVGSDGWSARALVATGRERAVEGTISVQPLARPVEGFREYFLNLTVHNNKRNPWFVEFWEEQFQCLWDGPGAARTPYNTHTRRCTGKEQLSNENTELEAQLQFVADAVLAFAHALRDMHEVECGGAPGLCPAMKPPQGPLLLRYLRNVRFTGLSREEFHFDSNGDGPARYNIMHFKQVEPGVFRWLRVGRYLDGELEIDVDEIQFKLESPRPPESVCSAECELGQAKQYVEGESCCWHCFNCTQYEIRAPESETACRECPRGTLPDETRTHCALLPADYLRPASPAARGAMAFSALGILFTVFVIGVWIWRGDTPVVRASGRELSYVLLGGILMCYLVTFALVVRPTDALCAVQRFGTGLCFTIVYAALLTKTNRIARIFAAGERSARRPAFISPRSQLGVCALLVGVQVVIVGVWQAAAPARAVRHLPSRETAVLVCDAYVDASYTLAFSYPAALIATCTVYAVLTRKIPEAFNESKHIGFTMYTTCVIWLAFVPLYFGTASHVALRVTTIAVTISLSASVTLACLFAPKVYIILFRPERNVRACLMPGRWRAAGGGAAGGAVCAALVGAAAPLPPRAPLTATPSTDRSTLNDDRTPSSCLDRQVQTDPSEFPSPAAPAAPPAAAELQLDARALRGGLPPFPLQEPPVPNGPCAPAPALAEKRL
ncbi:metabotropic glutamate receptor 6-like [Leguminivora glycinivorella]|uniref:metabotropic glutamate receptor 6-like n=1 Tax=Leguminivora glycinivorella TaxID=1035111 RepID=UPI00200F7AC9|nr:metabotropic glutamate receptor 6-like [Leguminivora glycinivorella]